MEREMNQIILPLLGGVLIGVASTLMLAGVGKITGISGILGSSLTKPSSLLGWRYAFLGGLIVGGAVLLLINPELFSYDLNFNVLRAVIAGLLVGVGTRLGSGCTSGHGVCGIARLSKRSVVATGLFMLFGMITVAAMRGLGL